jgi:protein tyrosine/serine phosphatase
VEYPIVMHCKSGADRVGLMSALYLIIHEGRPVEEAKRQLNWYYGHIRQTRTGILDYFLEAYEKANKQHPIAFMDWVEQEYDPEALRHAYKTTRWENLLDRLMNRE